MEQMKLAARSNQLERRTTTHNPTFGVFHFYSYILLDILIFLFHWRSWPHKLAFPTKPSVFSIFPANCA
jgi:hypothetical protein